LINNKIYIGVHKTKDINDDYMGSGKILKRAQEKYGIENFRKEILEVYDNAEDMFNMESQLVNENFVNDKETYNLKLGGYGGWDHLNTEQFRKTRNYTGVGINGGKKTKYMWENDISFIVKTKEINKDNLSKAREKQKELRKTGWSTFGGKKHSEETKNKMRQSAKNKQKGNKNSQFGTIWIYNLEEKLSKKIKKEELQDYEKLGWIKGRKIKF